MQPGKIDAGIGVGLEGGQTEFDVFVHTEDQLPPEALPVLARLNARQLTHTPMIYVATLSADQIAELSEQKWVIYLRRAQPRSPL